jgi:ribosomal-protein-alanine N-acetyltransferase
MMFETERLIIRYVERDDIERLVEYRNKPEVARYQSWDRYTLRQAKSRVKYIEKHPYTGQVKDNTQLAVLLKEGTLIGDLHVEVINHNTTTIGYTFDSNYWHHGYAREAVSALLDYLKEFFPQEKVIAYIYKQNEASRALLVDLGFKKFDESFFYDDEGYVLFIK